MTDQFKKPVSMFELADRLGRLIALMGKAQTLKGQHYPRTEAEIARELLGLAAEHGVTFDKGVRDALATQADSYKG